jgi:4-amino-4-deoxy-L-arabinose transferase-like glycosyltransferase
MVVIALAALLWLPNLFAVGMFMDGTINASVAKNYALGNGSFFHLHQTYMGSTEYGGNPPLAFIIQGWAFKIFGTAYYVERIYSLICAVIQLVLIRYLWQTLFNNVPYKKLSWLPCLLWLISPITGWCYSNNLLENTMSIFTTVAIISIAKYAVSNKYLLLYALVAVAAMCLALLTKGPVALFIAIVPLALTVVSAKYTIQKTLLFTAASAGLFLLAVTVFASSTEANIWLITYFNQQINPALSTKSVSTFGRFKIVTELVIMLSSLLGLWLAVVLVARYINTAKTAVRVDRKIAHGFLLVGLAASLPIVVSYKQSGFYLLPALPVFAIAIAAYMAEAVRTVADKWNSEKWHTRISVTMLIVIIACAIYSGANFGHVCRDKKMLDDVTHIAALTPNDTCLTADWNLNEEYALRAYLSRLHNKTVCYPNGNCSNGWILDKRNNIANGEKKLVYQGSIVSLYRSNR